MNVGSKSIIQTFFPANISVDTIGAPIHEPLTLRTLSMFENFCD